MRRSRVFPDFNRFSTVSHRGVVSLTRGMGTVCHYRLDLLKFQKELLSIGPPVYFVVSNGLNYTDPAHQNLFCGGIGCSTDSLATVIMSASKSPKE